MGRVDTLFMVVNNTFEDEVGKDNVSSSLDAVLGMNHIIFTLFFTTFKLVAHWFKTLNNYCSTY